MSRVVLPAWVAPATTMFSPATTAASRKRAGAGHGAEPDEFIQGVRAQDEFADVDGPVPPGDVGDDHVQPGAVGEGGVHEWGSTGRSAGRWSAASARPG